MYYFSPLFIKDTEMIDARNRGTVKALERSIALAKKARLEN